MSIRLARLATRLLPQLLILNAVYSVARGETYSLPAKKAKGHLHFLTKTVNFGRVMQGQELRYRFHFKNTGQGPLQIQGVHAACGCTVIAVDPLKVYQPGELGSLDLRFITKNFLGPIQKAVTVLTDEPRSPGRTLSVLADIRADYLVDKPVVDFGAIPLGTAPSEELTFSPRSHFALQLSEPQYNHNLFTVSLQPEAKRWKVAVQLKPTAPLGLIKERIKIVSNSTTMPEFELIVRARVQGPISAEPQFLDFGPLASAATAKRLLQFTGAKPFQLTKGHFEIYLNGEKIAAPAQALLWEGREDQGTRQSIEVKLNHFGKQSGPVHGKILFASSETTQQEVSVDFYAFFL